jgi:pilus assembly protein CpaE
METKLTTILVIDGDPTSCSYLARKLTKNGYRVITASLGREGLISAWKDLPDLAIMDPALPDITGLELISRVRQDRRTGNLPFIALTGKENPQEMSALLAAGCSEYLVKSSDTLERVLDIIPRVLNVDQKPSNKGKLIAFLSAKGGTGTSSLCANIAMAMASEHPEKKIAVVDLVLPIGSIADIVGFKDNHNLTTAAMQKPGLPTIEYLQENMWKAPLWQFNLLAGAPDPESANRLPGERVTDILKAIVESHDYICVDLGRSLSRISLPIIEQAGVIALILSTDLATANLTLSVCEYLKAKGIDPAKMYAIQNRAVGLEGLTRADLEKKVGLPVRVTMPYMGDNFTVANNRNEPIIARSPNDSASLLLKQIAQQMMEMGTKVKP